VHFPDFTIAEELMTRTEVIQRIIDKTKAKTYLEIGVAGGANFFPIRARQKTAVDPNFRLSRKKRLKWTLKYFYNLMAQFHESSSDSYFARKKSTDRFDLVFIDGLHTYEQSLTDVHNSLSSLNEGGVIILHDCSPPSQAAAHPAASHEHAAGFSLPGWTGEWCGDVWKTICHLRSHRTDLRVFVLDCDFGLGIVTRGEPDSRVNLSQKELSEMTYEDLAGDRENLLNLKDVSYLPEFLEGLRSVARQ
jgi:Methyltransferase domain